MQLTFRPLVIGSLLVRALEEFDRVTELVRETGQTLSLTPDGVCDTYSPAWLRPDPVKDLAARVLFDLANRDQESLTYLTLADSPVHAITRVLLIGAGLDREHILKAKPPRNQPSQLLDAADVLFRSETRVYAPRLPLKKLRRAVVRHLRHHETDCLVVDDLSGAVPRDSKYPEQDRWRVQAELREAVRGTKVRLIFAGTPST